MHICAEKKFWGLGDYFMKLMNHFDISEESNDQTKPTLQLNINIAPGVTETMIMYEGDTAETVAKDFCQKHGLNLDLETAMQK